MDMVEVPAGFAVFGVAMLAIQVAVLFVIVYFAARLAIRHEQARRTTKTTS
jgi:hypothetical protein